MISTGLRVFLILTTFASALATENPFAGKRAIKLGSQKGFFEGDLEFSMNRNAIKQNSSRRWPNATVYYQWSDQKWTQAHYDMMSNAMRMIEKHTCVRFIERLNNETNFVYIINGAACSSNSVGMAGGYQRIQLRDDKDIEGLDTCWYSMSTVMHELLHAVGLAHEHTRPDRDEYIEVHPENYKGYDFQYQIANYTVTYGVEYNYKSVMHYDAYSSSTNGLPSMTPKKPGVSVEDLGSGSMWDYETDWEKIRRIYECKGTYPLEPCVDTYSACDWAKGRGQCDEDWMKYQCAVSCGFCPNGVPIASNEKPCEDTITYCYQYANDCGKPGSEWLKSSCRKTCNLCPSTATPKPGTECKDEYDQCEKYKPLPCTANHYSYQLCKKTCGLC